MHRVRAPLWHKPMSPQRPSTVASCTLFDAPCTCSAAGNSCFGLVVCWRCRYIQHQLLPPDAAETAHLFNAFFYKRYTTVGRKKVAAVAARCIRDVNWQMFVAVRNAARATSAACRCVPQSTLVYDVGMHALAHRRASARRCVHIVQAYASVERWTAGVNLFQKKIVFVPIHRRCLSPPAIAPSGRVGRCFRTCCLVIAACIGAWR